MHPDTNIRVTDVMLFKRGSFERMQKSFPKLKYLSYNNYNNYNKMERL